MYKKKYYRASPYSQILQDKKKAYASKYGIDAFKDNWKRQADISVIFSKMKKKSVKVSSAEKSAQQTKKKRHRTQYIDPKTQSIEAKMQYQSFNEPQVKESKHLHTKSLFMQKYSQLFEQHKLPVDTKKIQTNNSPTKKQLDFSATFQNDILKNCDKISIRDIDSLINLIQNCVRQAQEYISHLSTEMNQIKQQLEIAKSLNDNLQHNLRQKTVELVQKNNTIDHLQKQIEWVTINNIEKDEPNEPFEVRKLLEIVSKLKSDNEQLRHQLENVRTAEKIKDGNRDLLYGNNVEISIEKKKKNKNKQGSPKKQYRSQSNERSKNYKKY